MKKFSRAIYEIRNPNTNYLTYDLRSLGFSKSQLVYDFYDDVDFYWKKILRRQNVYKNFVKLQ